MAKRKRPPRAKHKIEGTVEGTLIKVNPDPFVEAPTAVVRSKAVIVARSTLFTAEFEAVIELIARERVYRAMLDGLGRRLLLGAPHSPTGSSVAND